MSLNKTSTQRFILPDDIALIVVIINKLKSNITVPTFVEQLVLKHLSYLITKEISPILT